MNAQSLVYDILHLKILTNIYYMIYDSYDRTSQKSDLPILWHNIIYIYIYIYII